MSGNRLFARLLGAAALCTTVSAAAGPMAPLLHSLGLDHAHSVSYLDRDGKPLSEDQFSKKAFAGGSFDIQKHKGADGGIDAVLRLENPKTAAKQARTVDLAVGDVLPSFTLPDLTQHAVGNADLRGHYTLLNFYFAECVGCIQELPELKALQHAHPELRLLAITPDSRADAVQFAAQRQVDWTILPEAQPLLKSIKLASYPLLILVAPDGKVRALRSGYQTGKDTVSAWVTAALKTTG